MYEINSFMAELERKNPAQSEFIQAVREVVESVIDTVNENPVYLKNKILDRYQRIPNRTGSSPLKSNGKTIRVRSRSIEVTGCSSTTQSDPIRADSGSTHR